MLGVMLRAYVIAALFCAICCCDQSSYLNIPLVSTDFTSPDARFGTDIWSSIFVDFDQGLCPPITPGLCPGTPALLPCCADCSSTPDPLSTTPPPCACSPFPELPCLSSSVANVTLQPGVNLYFVPFVPGCNNALITFRYRQGYFPLTSDLEEAPVKFPSPALTFVLCANNTVAFPPSFNPFTLQYVKPPASTAFYLFTVPAFLSSELSIDIVVADSVHPDFLLPLNDYYHLNPLARGPLSCNDLDSVLLPMPNEALLSTSFTLQAGERLTASAVGNSTRAVFATKAGVITADGVRSMVTNFAGCQINVTDQWLTASGTPFQPTSVPLLPRQPVCDASALPAILTSVRTSLEGLKISSSNVGYYGVGQLLTTFSSVLAQLSSEQLMGCLSYAFNFGSSGTPITVATITDQRYCDPTNTSDACCQSIQIDQCCAPRDYDISYAPWAANSSLVSACAQPACASQAVNDLSLLLQPTFLDSCRLSDDTDVNRAFSLTQLCKNEYEACGDIANGTRLCSTVQKQYYGCSDLYSRCLNATYLNFVICTLKSAPEEVIPTLRTRVKLSENSSIDYVAVALLANYTYMGCINLDSIYLFDAQHSYCPPVSHDVCNWAPLDNQGNFINNCTINPLASPDFCFDTRCTFDQPKCIREISDFALCTIPSLLAPSSIACDTYGGVWFPPNGQCIIANATMDECAPATICDSASTSDPLMGCLSRCIFPDLDAMTCDCVVQNGTNSTWATPCNSDPTYLAYDITPVAGPVCRYNLSDAASMTLAKCSALPAEMNAVFIRGGYYKPAGQYTTQSECESYVCFRPGTRTPVVAAANASDCAAQLLCSTTCYGLPGCDGNATLCASYGGRCTNESLLTEAACLTEMQCSIPGYNYSECLNCSLAVWAPVNTWIPGESGPGIWAPRGQWLARNLININAQMNLFDDQNYTVAYIDAAIVAMSVVLQNHVICNQLAPASAALQLLCSCGASGIDPAACSAKSDPLLGLAYLCTGTSSSFDTPPVAFTAPSTNTYSGFLCATAQISLLPAGQFYQLFVPLYSSWFLSIIGNNPWAVVPNSQNIAVGQIAGDGVTIDLGPAAVTGSIYLCLDLRPDIPRSPIYNVPDFAAFDPSKAGPFDILQSPGAVLVNETTLCGTIALRSSEQSYIPILRTSDFASQDVESKLDSRQKAAFMAGAVLYGICLGIAFFRLLSMGAFAVFKESGSLLRPVGVMALLVAFYCSTGAVFDIFLTPLVRVVYFILVPKGKLVDVPQIIDSLLAEYSLSLAIILTLHRLPTYIYLSIFSILVVWWMRIYHADEKPRTLPLTIALFVFNAAMYITLIVIVAIYASRNRLTTGNVINCEVVRIGSVDTTLTKVYKCIIAGISFLLGIGFFIYAILILKKIWSTLRQNTGSLLKFTSLAYLAPLALIGQCIVLLYSTFKDRTPSSRETIVAISVQILVEIPPMLPLFFSVRNPQLEKASWLADYFGLWVCTDVETRSSTTSSNMHQTDRGESDNDGI